MDQTLPKFIRQSPYPLLIDGQEVAAQSGATFASINPDNGEILAHVAQAGEADVDRAVQAARRAFDGPWGRMTPRERSKALLRLASVLNDKAEMLAQIEMLDVGKPIKQSRASTIALAPTIEYYAGVLLGMGGETINVSDTTLMDFTLREPLGVCGLIVPWNYPVSLAVLKLAPALAAGNTVVIKPSEVTPLSTTELGLAVLEAGIPPGVVNIIHGTGAEAGDALARHPGVAKISFTGGTVTGRKIFRAAADSIKRLTLELGGKSPLVVFADSDIDAAVTTAYNDMTRNTGQVCAACTRLVVQRSVHDEFIEKLRKRLVGVKVGRPQDEGTEMGPIVNATQIERIHAYLQIANQEGVQTVRPVDLGARAELSKGYYMDPVLFLGANNDMRVAREEIFGPVQTVVTFDSEDDAVRIANDSPFGLAAAVFTRDAARAMRMARKVQAGTVCINHGAKAAVDAPFGGYKESGIGKERGILAMLDDTQVKNVRYALQ
ncbi:MAG: aldehyde dehydrogenase family protein [Burkholderiaceae bacterium]